MSAKPTVHKIKTISTLAFLLCSTTLLFAEQTCPKSAGNKENVSSEAEKTCKEELDLTNLQKEARMYRCQGLKLQNAGDLDSAMSLYQKAAVIDPTYAAVFNDMGIIHEARGLTDKAEENYLRCITIEPYFLSAYTNLALLYENTRQIEKAAACWERRASLGSPDDPWTKKASQRYNDIRLVLSDKPFDEAKEQEIVGLMKDVMSRKALLSRDDKALAKSFLKKAKYSYKKGDYVAALKLAVDAGQLDPTNKEIREFEHKVQTRLLSR
jgi:tetratricopeptide (TPR) repeat protein